MLVDVDFPPHVQKRNRCGGGGGAGAKPCSFSKPDFSTLTCGAPEVPELGTGMARGTLGCGVAMGVGADEGCGLTVFPAASSGFFSVFFAVLVFFFGVALAAVEDFLCAPFFGAGVAVSSSSDSFAFFFAAGVSLGEGEALGFFFGFDDFFFDGVVDFAGEGEASSWCWVLRNASRFRFSSSVN